MNSFKVLASGIWIKGFCFRDSGFSGFLVLGSLGGSGSSFKS